MDLARKIKKSLDRLILKKMGGDYRHAYELLSVENLEGFEEICEAPKEKLWNLVRNKYPETWHVLLHLGIGSDPRIKPVCQELGYGKLETELFCHISKKISYCSPINIPSKRMRKFQEKVVDIIKNYYLKKIKEDDPGDGEYKKILELVIKFGSDREYHLQIMDRFYKEIIPRLEERMKNKL